MAAIVETKELESVDLLRTHYYRASYVEIKAVYLKIVNEMGYSVVSVNDDYNEIFAESSRMGITAKIIEQNPKETSIDFYITADYLFGSKRRAYNFIGIVLSEIQKKYQLKGISLHK